MTGQSLELGRRAFGPQIADVVREARELIGWTQRELAERARTSHTTIWRLEHASSNHLDLAAIERVLSALGVRATLQMDARHLEDRRRQQDGVHARLTGFVARRLERVGWLTRTEVPIGDGVPRGWIDLLAFRQADAALVVEESKSDIVDMGGLQRSVAFYEREASAAARALGWRPRHVVVVVVVLDSVAVARRLIENRDIARRAFPERADELGSWIDDPAATRPRGWAMAMADPASRRSRWLLPTPLHSTRRTLAYANYADAAARLRARR